LARFEDDHNDRSSKTRFSELTLNCQEADISGAISGLPINRAVADSGYWFGSHRGCFSDAGLT